jgi:hypothetical protein
MERVLELADMSTGSASVLSARPRVPNMLASSAPSPA